MDDGRAHAGFADVTITYKQPKKHNQTHKYTQTHTHKIKKSAHTPARTFSNTYTPLVLYALTHLIKAKTKDPERRSGPVRGVDSIDSSRFGGSRTVKRTPPSIAKRARRARRRRFTSRPTMQSAISSRTVRRRDSRRARRDATGRPARSDSAYFFSLALAHTTTTTTTTTRGAGRVGVGLFRERPSRRFARRRWMDGTRRGEAFARRRDARSGDERGRWWTDRRRRRRRRVGVVGVGVRFASASSLFGVVSRRRAGGWMDGCMGKQLKCIPPSRTRGFLFRGVSRDAARRRRRRRRRVT